MLFGALFKKPSERRTTALLEMLSEAVTTLEHRQDVDFAALRNSDQFGEFAHDVLRAASKTSRTEKLTAFRNVLVNSAISPTPGETKARVFLRLVDDLDVHHILLLHLMADPGAFLQSRGLPFPQPGAREIEIDAATMHQSPRSLESVVGAALRDELPSELTELVMQDLLRCGLIPSASLAVLCRPGKPLVSNLGMDFIRFISDPS